MQCDYCENQATVHYTQIIEGASKKASLCEKCATEQGVTDPESFLLDKKTSSSKKPAFLSPNVPASQFNVSKTGECPQCGFTFDDLKKTGRLGCNECYQFFRKEIQINLGNMHKGVKHKGRIPEGMVENIQLRQKTDKLESDLAEAIKNENFEKAAKLRDELKNLAESSSSK